MSGEVSYRFARAADAERIQHFFDAYWKKGHVFAKNAGLLRWQHQRPAGDRLNFVLAETDSGELAGLLGFIPTSQFDPALEAQRDVWLAVWKTRTDLGVNAAGFQQLWYLQQQLEPQTICAVGLSKQALMLYKALGYRTGRLEHYNLLNPAVREFRIARVNGQVGAAVRASGSISVYRLDAAALEGYSAVCEAHAERYRPRKTPRYYRTRYLEHPSYRYEIYGAKRDGAPVGLLVTRAVEAQGAKALRIVDLCGAGAFEWVGEVASALLARSEAEYADLYCYGIDGQELLAGGLKRRQGDEIVLPCYFEPFEASNVELDFGYLSKAPQKFVIVKGDSDQDRPNA